MSRSPWLMVPAMLLGITLQARAATTAEQSLREVDAAWVRAAQSASIDGWMAFYTDDALVMPPNAVAAASLTEVRKSIAELLELPKLKIEWHPTRIEISAAGDLAALAGAYSLAYVDPSGATVSDRGKLLEVWRRQRNGAWKCVIDTWNSDLAAPLAAAPAPAPVPVPVPVPLPAPAGTMPVPEAPSVPSQAQLESADYGEMPHHYEDAIHGYFRRVLANPQSVRYGAISAPQRGYLLSAGLFIRHPSWQYGWTVTATVDAQSSWGAYVGAKTYTFLFRGEKLVGSVAPPAEGEMK